MFYITRFLSLVWLDSRVLLTCWTPRPETAFSAHIEPSESQSGVIHGFLNSSSVFIIKCLINFNAEFQKYLNHTWSARAGLNLCTKHWIRGMRRNHHWSDWLSPYVLTMIFPFHHWGELYPHTIAVYQCSGGHIIQLYTYIEWNSCIYVLK